MPEINADRTCPRCGIVWQVNTTRKPPDVCSSCRARKQTKIGDCLIWQGNYADDMITPITEDGELVVEGVPTCGHNDCVLAEHRRKVTE
jgi:hypothetical protein